MPKVIDYFHVVNVIIIDNDEGRKQWTPCKNSPDIEQIIATYRNLIWVVMFDRFCVLTSRFFN